MGTSFTGFNGYGFWSRDDYVSLWMANLVEKMDLGSKTLTSNEVAFRDDLILQASICCTGAVHDCLEHVAKSDHLKEWAIEMGGQALNTYATLNSNEYEIWSQKVLRAPGAIGGPVDTILRPDTVTSHSAYGLKWISLLTGDFEVQPIHPTGMYQLPGKGPVWDIEADVREKKDQND